MQSIESDALEPTKAELRDLTFGQKAMRLAPTYGLVILTVVLLVLFSILLPNLHVFYLFLIGIFFFWDLALQLLFQQ